jgi:hypothetical protein
MGSDGSNGFTVVVVTCTADVGGAPAVPGLPVDGAVEPGPAAGPPESDDGEATEPGPGTNSVVGTEPRADDAVLRAAAAVVDVTDALRDRAVEPGVAETLVDGFDAVVTPEPALCEPPQPTATNITAAPIAVRATALPRREPVTGRIVTTTRRPGSPGRDRAQCPGDDGAYLVLGS